ncbi:glycosyltransferase family 2 protein, partial [Paracoccus sanguinis]|uniref:glycosyltransferase family 2 protein n=1 Tax=Paracoccus sanguinis TaxID=1545044 RepID=UPI001E468EA2
PLPSRLARPRRPPTGDGRVSGLGHVLLSSMRDEGPYVLEYVAHHRAIGFDRLFIASNDCRDGTDLVLDALDAAGAVTHHRSTLAPRDIPQHAAYAAMRKAHGLDRAEWLMVLDADEFLDVTTGAGRVQDLTDAAGADADIIILNPHTFGSTEDPLWHPGLVTEQFTRRAAARSAHNAPVKSLARGLDRFGAIHNHSVTAYSGAAPLTVMRGDGTRFTLPGDDPHLWRNLRRLPVADIRHGLAHYNHYAVKSLAAYCLRQLRGRGARPVSEANTRHDTMYFDRLARLRVQDTGFAARHGDRLRAEYARLLALPGVAEAQAETERRYGALIEALV